MGKVDLHPNLINVIAARARLSVDLRNTEELLLQEAERRLARFLEELARAESVTIDTRRLARFEPVQFDDDVARMIESHAARLGCSHRRMTSGAGHDAQMLARICPASMVFVPSVKGISHNPAEHTAPADLAAGANVLLHTLMELASQ
jgi:N-carbamoyl-L-amino-acid hydrolase